MKKKFVPLDVSQWPPLDREMWIAAKQPGDLFDETGRAAAWSHGTVRLTEEGYGLYLGRLQDQGQLDPDMRPIDRVDAARVGAFVKEYSVGRAPHTIALAVRAIAYAIRATHPPDGLSWLTKMAHSMANHAKPVKSKTPHMATIAELLKLGAGLLKVGEGELDRGHRRGAQIYRDGLMICALITRPLRRRNFSALEIGRTLIVSPDAVRVFFEGKETKTGKQIDFVYPHFLRPAFCFYLEKARPILHVCANGPDNTMLWVGRRCQAMDGEEIAQRIGVVTERHLGRRMWPHLFRDCLATDVAIHDSEQVGIVKEVLGHATFATTEKYYIQAGSFHVSRRMQDVVAQLRVGH
jgi:hypothetical protein